MSEEEFYDDAPPRSIALCHLETQMSADKELIERADRELLADLGARLGRGEVIGRTPFAIACWHALARLEALQPSPETSLQNMQTRGAVGREEIARLIWFVHGDDLNPRNAMSGRNDAHWNSWKSTPDAESAFRAADAILALFSSSPTVEGWQPISSAPRDGTTIQARIPGHGDDNMIAWIANALDDGRGSCGAWTFTHEDQEPPDCWSDGWCWAVNEDGVRSAWPTHWLPPAPQNAGGE